MILKELNINNFRNYPNQKLILHKGINFFIGDNAQGKTNILESIYVLAFTKSYRTTNDSNLIKKSSDFAKINALINLNDSELELDIVLSKAGKKAKYNQIELERLSEYIGKLNVVMFAPEDLDLVKGNPRNRRQFLDLEIGQISSEYLYNLKQYRNILKQRNQLLKSLQNKKERDYMLLDVLTDQLVDYQKPIIEKRTHFIKEISDLASQHYKKISSTTNNLTITYTPSLVTNLRDKYEEKYRYDILKGTTTSGIHRDDISFELDGFDVKSHSSQGEQRTLILAVKLALVDFIYQHKNTYPVLLLDDVLSELDETRQNNLINYLKNATQTLITTTNISEINLEEIETYKLFKINQGSIEESDTYE
ncbi:MAG: DNA replication/repair protein RecF [Candidatus Izimaplasma sp.]|nr:DNA replication/repair protein RecF [Candidatus Izimaplasma bacterium]